MDSLIEMEKTKNGIRFSVDDDTRNESRRFIGVIEKRFAKALDCEPNEFGITIGPMSIGDQYENTRRYISRAIYSQGLGHCLMNDETWRTQKAFNEWLFDALDSQGYVKKDVKE